MNTERIYILKRKLEGKLQSIPFFMFRIFPINLKKIVFCCIEGTTGYSCNPKYISEELIRQKKDYELVWLVNDTTKEFPSQIRVKKNTLWNRAYQLTTAKIWIDNSRKQLEVRKRKGQIYIQTWHAKLGFKPTCLDRGKSFTKIAYLVSKHDSDMIDYVLSNSDWYDNTLPTGMIYFGPTLRFGSPRCDVLINKVDEMRGIVRQKYHLPSYAKIIMYAPTFRGGNQKTNRSIQVDAGLLNYDMLIQALEGRFGDEWYVMLRLHPQLVARNVHKNIKNDRIIDVSTADDMYAFLAGCDAFITDYSSAAFDAAVMKIPVFLYCNDYEEYQAERGHLLWDLEKLPFYAAKNNEMLKEKIKNFCDTDYKKNLQKFFADIDLCEDGKASERVVDFMSGLV